jgi:hypothetical protein
MHKLFSYRKITPDIMNELLTSIFKINATVKFNNADCDYKLVVDSIKSTGLFNVKEKTGESIKYGEDLTSKIFKDEIYVFKEIIIHIVQEDSSSINHIPITAFDTDMYIKLLKNLYENSCTLRDTSLFTKSTSLLRSFIINDYMDDKNKADTLFLLGRYGDSYKIYSKYMEYNDFSHYCIEMSVYCRRSYMNLPYHFIDTVYFTRLVYILFMSKEYDYLCYQIYKLSNKIDNHIMEELGKRLMKKEEYHRKGTELLYFYGKIDGETLNRVFKGMCNLSNQTSNIKLTENIDNLLCSEPFILKLSKLSILNYQNLFNINQYQAVKIQFKCRKDTESYYTYNKKENRIDEYMNILVKYKKVGIHFKDLYVKTDRTYHLRLCFIVKAELLIQKFIDYRIQSMTYVSIKTKSHLNVISKHKFNVTDGNILRIIKEDVLGVNELVEVNDTLNAVPNDPIYTDLDYKEFLKNKMKQIDIDKDTVLQLSGYKNQKISVHKDDEVYKINLKKKKVKKKIFIFVFNSYKLTECTKLNILVNNYIDKKYFMTISSPEIEIIDENFVLMNKLSSLFEMRCKIKDAAHKFSIRIKDENDKYADFDLCIDIS